MSESPLTLRPSSKLYKYQTLYSSIRPSRFTTASFRISVLCAGNLGLISQYLLANDAATIVFSHIFLSVLYRSRMLKVFSVSQYDRHVVSRLSNSWNYRSDTFGSRRSQSTQILRRDS